jgi:glycosyltransferase involved in cell wall biosynthesis
MMVHIGDNVPVLDSGVDGRQKLAVFPFESNYNQYINLMKHAYEKLGLNVVPFVGWHSREYSFVTLNWYEAVDDVSLFIRRIVILIKMSVERKKIIWTIHNKKPHDIKRTFFFKLLTKMLILTSYRIIIHSKSTWGLTYFFKGNNKAIEKTIFVPHPNYIGIYGDVVADTVKGNKLQLLFMGAVRPYKNIELLIETVKELRLPNLQLSIFGETVDDDYKQSLQRLIGRDDSITTDFEFIDNDRIPMLMASCHLLVLPYNLKSSLNSGTIVLAFSYKRTVLSPAIGTLADIPDKNIFFGYDYSTHEEHREQLKKEILHIYHMYRCNYDEILDVGEKCYEYVKKYNGMENTINALSTMMAR